jgi:hypothetical protein
VSTDRETTLAVRSWLEDGVSRLPDRVLDVVLDQVPATPQRRSGWPARRIALLPRIWPAVAAVTAVFAIGVAAYGVLRPNPIGAGPTLRPISVTGSFVSHGARIELHATGAGARVTGVLTATDVAGGSAVGTFTVALACAERTPSGLVLVGGLVTASRSYEDWAPVGTNVAVVLQPGTPVKAFIHSGDGPDCAHFLLGIGDIGDPQFESTALEPIEGSVDIQP